MHSSAFAQRVEPGMDFDELLDALHELSPGLVKAVLVIDPVLTGLLGERGELIDPALDLRSRLPVEKPRHEDESIAPKRRDLIFVQYPAFSLFAPHGATIRWGFSGRT